jgi:hypothetical protein
VHEGFNPHSQPQPVLVQVEKGHGGGHVFAAHGSGRIRALLIRHFGPEPVNVRNYKGPAAFTGPARLALSFKP